MIKFQATNPENGRRILGLGLSHGNVAKLMAGQPIHGNAEQMGLVKLDMNEVLIFVGATEESMRQEMEEKGYLEGTRIIEEVTTKQ